MSSSARLWAPWRSAFISRRKQPRGCIFCAAKRHPAEDRKRHVIARGRRVLALLNLYPYNNGHLLVAPYRHVGRFESLSAEEWAETLRLTQRLLRRLTATLHPHGFNIGINLGRASGAGIPGHLHLHLVPRWTGDANFMPIFGGARVISRSLDELYRLLTGPRTGKR